jgi:serine/threonine protein kinase
MHVKKSGLGVDEIQPLRLQPEQRLQDVADSMVIAATLQFEDMWSCRILESPGFIKVDGNSDFKIPLFMTHMAMAQGGSSGVSVVVIASHPDKNQAAVAWIFLCEEAQLLHISKLLSLQGVIRSDLSSMFCKHKQVGHGSFAKVNVGDIASHGQREKVVAKQMEATVPKADVVREAQMLMAVQGNNNIIEYIGTFHDLLTGRWTILTEYVQSGDLRTFLNSRALAEKEAWSLSTGLLKALSHLQSYEVPILHRDVKVENVLVQTNYNAKLCDFGLACFLNDEKELLRSCGSAGSVAPEMYAACQEGVIISSKVDNFSLGVVMAHMLTSKHPFAGSCMEKMARRNFRCQVDYTTRRWLQVNPDAMSVTQALLQRRPENRASVDEVMLMSWIEKEPGLCSTGLQLPQAASGHINPSGDTSTARSRCASPLNQMDDSKNLPIFSEHKMRKTDAELKSDQLKTVDSNAMVVPDSTFVAKVHEHVRSTDSSDEPSATTCSGDAVVKRHGGPRTASTCSGPNSSVASPLASPCESGGIVNSFGVGNREFHHNYYQYQFRPRPSFGSTASTNSYRSRDPNSLPNYQNRPSFDFRPSFQSAASVNSYQSYGILRDWQSSVDSVTPLPFMEQPTENHGPALACFTLLPGAANQCDQTESTGRKSFGQLTPLARAASNEYDSEKTEVAAGAVTSQVNSFVVEAKKARVEEKANSFPLASASKSSRSPSIGKRMWDRFMKITKKQEQEDKPLPKWVDFNPVAP